MRIVRFALRRRREIQVGLDSQCFSYLLDAIAGVTAPIDELAAEKIALLRTWFYTPGTYTLVNTVIVETARIRNIERRELHESFAMTLFLDYPVRDQQKVDNRVAELLRLHPRERDCQILAEAEDLGLDFLLTYDHDLWRRLSGIESATKLMKPMSYWQSLNIPIGADPVTIPHYTNPLSQQTWWRI